MSHKTDRKDVVVVSELLEQFRLCLACVFSMLKPVLWNFHIFDDFIPSEQSRHFRRGRGCAGG
ncbi:hypothetical protein C454_18109 [Haloferax gibbonsii ATCC 33959]|uniref:Uncharacterized protein n=1 Tax=Haloferax gibbonsii (strain ATCC 33959 / DSM 4427 / JCM 8863 / NBRC 102184 / NCIMB 2188 / Ma 2.38) TaxID=1227459 RepID=M0GXK8_HALGM|nr:hypothetical protein C454_18109 [Haloferax gibbonsii ATCC 33959]